MDLLVAAIPLVPILSAILILLLQEQLRHHSAWLSTSAAFLTFLLAVVVLVIEVTGEEVAQSGMGEAGGYLLADPLSAIMGVLIAGISLIVHKFSIRYMAEEAGYARFFMLLDLMTASLLVLVSASDMLTLVVAWHLVGVLLYLLLGHDTSRTNSLRYAFWTFITYRLGDIALVLGVVVLVHTYDTWSIPELLRLVREDPHAMSLLGVPATQAAALLMSVAAFARSAQFLLHNWLPYTMDGPTPVSALMHAGIVNAGGFLINRFAPVFVYSGDVLHLLFIMGLVTAIIGSVLMLAQNDIKKSLGYSTMGQMGFMIMECGVGAFSLAIYHLIAHGLFKGALFLGAGGVIGAARHDDGVPKEDLYTFVIERRPARRQPPWLFMAAVTLIIPVFVLVLAHLLVQQDFFQKQGAVVLLFFGWITGAQLIFATYRMRSERPGRLLALVLSSFVVVVVGYALISHVFEQFLYPDEKFLQLMHHASSIDIVWFDILVVVTTLIIVGGWLLTYYAEKSGKNRSYSPGRLRLILYALISREFYLADIYTWMSRGLLRLAARLNVLLRWA